MHSELKYDYDLLTHLKTEIESWIVDIENDSIENEEYPEELDINFDDEDLVDEEDDDDDMIFK